jgi:hypothetical protein
MRKNIHTVIIRIWEIELNPFLNPDNINAVLMLETLREKKLCRVRRRTNFIAALYEFFGDGYQH